MTSDDSRYRLKQTTPFYGICGPEHLCLQFLQHKFIFLKAAEISHMIKMVEEASPQHT